MKHVVNIYKFMHQVDIFDIITIVRLQHDNSNYQINISSTFYVYTLKYINLH